MAISGCRRRECRLHGLSTLSYCSHGEWLCSNTAVRYPPTVLDTRVTVAYSLIQLKVMQEVITLVVFVVFSIMAFEGFELRWNHIAAFALLVGAVYLVFMK